MSGVAIAFVVWAIGFNAASSFWDGSDREVRVLPTATPSPTPKPTPGPSPKPSPTPTVDPDPFGRVDVVTPNPDEPTFQPTALLDNVGADNLAAYVRVTGQWSGEVRIPVDAAAEHVRCRSNPEYPGGGYGEYQLTTSNNENGFEEDSSLGPGELSINVSHEVKQNDPPRSFVVVRAGAKERGYTGQDEDYPAPSEPPEGVLRWDYPSLGVVRFSGNTVLSNISGPYPDPALGNVYFEGWMICPTIHHSTYWP